MGVNRAWNPVQRGDVGRVARSATRTKRGGSGLGIGALLSVAFLLCMCGSPILDWWFS